MLLRKREARAGLQVVLEGCPLFLCRKANDDIELPGPVSCRVCGTSFVVFLEAGGEVLGHADVAAFGMRHASDYVDVPHGKNQTVVVPLRQGFGGHHSPCGRMVVGEGVEPSKA